MKTPGELPSLPPHPTLPTVPGLDAASLSSVDLMDLGGPPQLPPLILVADDDRTIRAVLQSSLERNGFRVVTADNGQEAHTLALKHLPEMILLDVRMPLMDGFEVVERLRRDPSTMRIPVIFLTALARESSDAARGLNLGADDYLHKPFGVDELLARVVRKIHDRRLEERLQRRTQELEALIHLGSQLNETLSTEELADRLTRLTLDQIAGDVIGLMIQQGKTNTVYRRRSGQPIELVPEGAALTTYIFESQKLILVQTRAEAAGELPFTLAESVHSVVGAPMIHNGEARGALVIVSDQPHQFTRSSLRLLRSIAEQAALAIQNAQLYSELSGYASDLASMVEARTAALMNAQKQLTRSEKLAAIGTLAAGVAHEVNNPLQPILTNLEMVLEDIDAGQPINRDDLVTAYENVNRIKGLVRRLLDFARPESHQMRPFYLREVTDEVLALAAKQLEQSHIVVERHWAAARQVVGNPDQLKQVILNLVVNAWEVMPGGGTLTLSTQVSDDEIMLQVKDTGPGIPNENLTRIFDPFFTTKATGTGIGLAMSQSIIEGHGGHLEVENVATGHGARFTIRLPLYKGDGDGL
jgi:signal transduction histidine kinase/FixJ family two-component response regulator